MELLKSLGINSTLWIQLACFIISYISISNLVLKPYMAAMREREARTTGGEETAVRLIEETAEMNAELEKKARAMHSTIKGYYDESRAHAMKLYDQAVSSARAEAAQILSQSRSELSKEVQETKQKLSKDIPSIGAAIASKLAGKDISV